MSRPSRHPRHTASNARLGRALVVEAIEDNLKQRKPTAIMCEQTASFALMTNLCSLLSEVSENIIPLSFWVTREGSFLSQLCDDGRPLRLIGFFPRRPKLSSVASSQFLIKINAQVIDAFARAAEVQIPLILGVPLVTSILNYRLDAPCAWYRPVDTEQRDQDRFLRLDLAGSITGSAVAALAFEGPLDARAVVDLAVSENPPRRWTDAIAVMRHILRPETNPSSFSLFGMRHYRPCFVAF